MLEVGWSKVFSFKKFKDKIFEQLKQNQAKLMIKEELLAILNVIAKGKMLGPNMVLTEFFQTMWHVIKIEHAKMVRKSIWRG
jgi:hypothetical protein